MKTKERETHSSAKEIGVSLLYAKWKALKQMKGHGQNQGKARLAEAEHYWLDKNLTNIILQYTSPGQLSRGRRHKIYSGEVRPSKLHS